MVAVLSNNYAVASGGEMTLAILATRHVALLTAADAQTFEPGAAFRVQLQAQSPTGAAAVERPAQSQPVAESIATCVASASSPSGDGKRKAATIMGGGDEAEAEADADATAAATGVNGSSCRDSNKKAKVS